MTSRSFNRPYQSVTYKANGGIQSQSSGFVVERERDDKSALVKTPKGKWRPPTAYSRTIEKGDVYTVRFAKDYKEPSTGFHYLSSGYNDCSGFWYRSIDSAPSYLEDQCITQALVKLKAMQVNIAQNIGEKEQTARLVASSIRRVAGLVKYTRRTAVRIAKDPFALWLELQYGWKPLLSDVYGATQELLHLDPDRVTVRGRAQDRFEYTDVRTLGRTSPSVLVDRLTRGVHNVYVRLDYENGNDAARLAASTGLTNPADLAWELLPFSFVADWSSNIGDCFSVLDADFGWNFKGGSCTTMSRMNYRGTNPRVAPNIGTYIGGCSVDGRATSMKMTRKVYGSSPLPQRPHFNDRYSSMHVANGVALLYEAFKGKIGVR